MATATEVKVRPIYKLELSEDEAMAVLDALSGYGQDHPTDPVFQALQRVVYE